MYHREGERKGRGKKGTSSFSKVFRRENMEGAALTEMALSKVNGTPGTVVKKLCINTEKKANKKFDMEGW